MHGHMSPRDHRYFEIRYELQQHRPTHLARIVSAASSLGEVGHIT